MEYLYKISGWIESTHVLQQIAETDYHGLVANPWFMVPFCLLLCVLLLKRHFELLLVLVMAGALWWVSGTDYMGSLVVDGKMQVAKIVPVFLGGIVGVGILIYVFFFRSD